MADIRPIGDRHRHGDHGYHQGAGENRNGTEGPGGTDLIGPNGHLGAPLQPEQKIGHRNGLKNRMASYSTDSTMPMVVKMAIVEQKISR
jgi:hypothetical protein